MAEIIGTILKEKVRRDSWVVASVRLEGDNSRCEVQTYFDEGEVVVGSRCRFYGDWQSGPFGDQFKASHFAVESITTKEGVQLILQLASGIGKATAAKLWKLYGDEAIRTIVEAPLKVAEETSLSVAKAQEASEKLAEYLNDEATKVHLLGMLRETRNKHRIMRAAMRLCRPNPVERITRNPYLLAMTPGVPCGFATADELWRNLRADGTITQPDKRKRGVLALIAQLEDSHTWWTPEQLTAKLNAGSFKYAPEEIMKLAIRAKAFVSRRDERGLMFAPAQRARDEETVARKAIDLQRERGIWPNVDELEGLSDHQRDMLRPALRSRIACVGGSPGTGKTYTVAQIVKGLLAQGVSRQAIRVCAFTGKAARRAAQLLEEAGVEVESSTIHRLLEYQGDNGFARHRTNPIVESYVIVDEASMLGTELTARLFDAIPAGGHVLLVGDIQQLPPVASHGAVLRDLIRGEIDYCELSEIRRNSGSIVEQCHAMKAGQKVRFDEVLSKELKKNLKLREAQNDADAIGSALSLVKKMLADTSFSAEDIQCISATNAVRMQANRSLQHIYNPTGREIVGFRGRDNWKPKIGDRVICLKNSPAFMNGEQGVITGTKQQKARTAPPKVLTIRNYQGEEIDVERTEVETNWAAGDCITCHKSQGSEFPVAVVIMPNTVYGEEGLASRAWLYTAMSRAKVLCFVIGKRWVADKMVSVVQVDQRQTALAQLLAEGVATNDDDDDGSAGDNGGADREPGEEPTAPEHEADGEAVHEDEEVPF